MNPVKTTTESAATKDGIFYVRTTPIYTTTVNGKDQSINGQSEAAGDTAYAELVDETIKLAALTDEPKVKVILSKVCVEVHKKPDKTIAVVYKVGAQIVKSLQRMVRRLARPSEAKASHHTTNPKSAATLAHEGPDGRGHDGEVPDGGYGYDRPA